MTSSMLITNNFHQLDERARDTAVFGTSVAKSDFFSGLLDAGRETPPWIPCLRRTSGYLRSAPGFAMHRHKSEARKTWASLIDREVPRSGGKPANQKMIRHTASSLLNSSSGRDVRR